MLVELVRTQTADGLRVDGALRSVDDGQVRRKPAVIVLHGVGGKSGAGLDAAVTLSVAKRPGANAIGEMRRRADRGHAALLRRAYEVAVIGLGQFGR